MLSFLGHFLRAVMFWGWGGAAAEGNLAGLGPFNEVFLLGGVKRLISLY